MISAINAMNPAAVSAPLPADFLVERLRAARVMAVVTLEQVTDVVPLVAALRAGGVRAVEVALRTPSALEALRLMRAVAPDFLLGAGTVLTPAQADAARAAGANFALAPGLDAATVRHCAQLGLPFVPGVATATDIQAAWALGCGCQKFFPAEALGGGAGLRLLAAPFAHLPVNFLPLGGIDETRLPAYLALPAVAAVGGSWIAPTELIRQQAWSEIERRAAAATKFL